MPATSVRVQGPGPAITLSFEDGATLDDLRERIASEMAIPASSQELRAGFPPQVLGAAGSALISSELGGSARILVKNVGAEGSAGGGSGSGSGGGTSSSQAGGRKKAQVQRVQDGANPRDVQARADAVAAATAAQRAAAEQDAEPALPAKHARAKARFLTPEESAAELLGDDAPPPRKRAPKAAAATAAAPAGADPPVSTEQAATSSSAAPPAASKASAEASGKAAGRAPKPKTPEQIAAEYYLGANPSSKAGTRAPGRPEHVGWQARKRFAWHTGWQAGAPTVAGWYTYGCRLAHLRLQTGTPTAAGSSSHLTDLGTIEHRVGAVRARKFELVEVGPARLQATFKAVRKQARRRASLTRLQPHTSRSAAPRLQACSPECARQCSYVRTMYGPRAVLMARQVCETVQLLHEEEMRAVLAALASRGSSSRGRANSHLLSLREMASRSPALLWSLALAFDGDVEGGLRQLQEG